MALSILHARELGLRLPIVYNTSSFDSLESLRLLDGLVDIYLPDFKVWKNSTSKRLLKADNYTATAMESIKAMYAQVGDLCFTPDGIAKRGVLVRHLVMPGLEDEGQEIMKWLADNVSRDLFVNIMEQYHPDAHVGKPKHASAGLEQHKSKSSNKSVEIGSILPRRDKTPTVRYEEINRPITRDELSSVSSAARSAGLWRFCDVAEHGGFNI